MGELPSSYKLTVVGGVKPDEYYVGNYYKLPLKTVQGLPGVIEAVGRYNSEILARDPCYRYLPQDVQDVVEAVRIVLLKRDEALMKNLAKPVETRSRKESPH